MKKNININLFGVIYAIDEDAYDLLKKYLENMRSYYCRRTGGEEIANDVENRVAELFGELRAQGVEAITIEHVEEIIKRIGDPQQMDDDSTETSGGERVIDGGYAESVEKEGIRKLYRDSEDKILGGVISGICHYFGINDPMLARFIFLLLVLFSHAVLIIVYAACWALIPEAKTAEERLQMKGKPVNPNAINEELMKGVNRAKEYVQNPDNQRKASGCFGTLLKICFFSIVGFCAFVVGSILLAILITIGISVVVPMFGLGAMFTDLGMDPDFYGVLTAVPVWLQWTLAASAVMVFGIPLFMLLHRLMRNPEGKPMSTGAVVTLVIAWIIALAVAISSIIPVIGSMANYENYHFKHYRTEVMLQQPAAVEEAVFA